MKKIIVLLMMVGSLFISGNSIFADAFDDCFEIERLKAKSDGLGYVEASELAIKVCRAKLGGTQSQEPQTPTQTNAKKDGGLFVSVFANPLYANIAFGINGGIIANNVKLYISQSSYQAELRDDKLTLLLLRADYVTDGGFLIGAGFGQGKVGSLSNTATQFSIGYGKNKKEGILFSTVFYFATLSEKVSGYPGAAGLEISIGTAF